MKTKGSELKRRAREMLLGKYGIPMLAWVLYGLILGVLSIPFSIDITRIREIGTTQIAMAVLANLILSLIEIIFSVGLIRIALCIARKKEYALADIFYCFKNHPDRVILATLRLLLYMIPPIAMVASVIVYLQFATYTMMFLLLALGILVLAVIWMVVISLRYTLCYFLLLDHTEWGMDEIFSKSRELMQGQKGRFFLLQLSFIGLEILGVLSFGIGQLWIVPYMNQTVTCFYLDLIGESVDESSVDIRV